MEGKAAPAAAAQPKISTGQPARLSPAKLSSGIWASQESSASTQPKRCPTPPPVLKAPQGATKTHQDSKGQVCNIITVTPEPGKQPLHPQAGKRESKVCAGNTSLFLERRESNTRELWVLIGLTNPPVCFSLLSAKVLIWLISQILLLKSAYLIDSTPHKSSEEIVHSILFQQKTSQNHPCTLKSRDFSKPDVETSVQNENYPKALMKTRS